MRRKWEYDSDFATAMRLLHPEDYELAMNMGRKGHADAQRRMQLRYEGWRTLTDLAELSQAATRAAEQLRRR